MPSCITIYLMKKDPLNHRLIESFPILEEIYPTVKDGCFDMDTPSNAFFEEVFVPYILSMIEKKNEKEICHCFSFIEEMMNDEDEHTEDIAMSSVLVPLSEKIEDILSLPLGKKSLSYYKEWIDIQG